MFFFFQAEDGIRDLYVTGVQTCALPISLPAHSPRNAADAGAAPAAKARACRSHRPKRSSSRPMRARGCRSTSHPTARRSEEHTSELQSRRDLVCRLLLEKKKKPQTYHIP